MNNTFYLKQNDTLPTLEVALTNPDSSPFDLTGCTVRLLVELNDKTSFIRDMEIFGTETNGIVHYQWETTDWDGTDPDGVLILGTAMGVSELNRRRHKHIMEYEVTTSDSDIITFPNSGYDSLIITNELG